MKDEFQAGDGSGHAGDIRVSDAERDTVVALLQQHASEGRLTLDEFSERVGTALRALTRTDLDAVMADLPAARSSATTVTRPRAVRRWFVGIMSGARAKGRWRTGDRVTAIAVMGGCELDFRRAVIDGPEVVVTAVAVMGGIEILVPEGVEVSLTGLPIMGGKRLHVADVPPLPGAPRLVVRAFPIMGGVSVRSRREGGGRSGGDVPPAFMPPAPHLPNGVTPPVPPGTMPPMPHVPPGVLPPMPPWLGSPVPEQSSAGVGLDGTVTIMFSDVCGFSELTERLGDVATHRLLREYNRLVRELVAVHDGRVVKANGDGFMVVFASAARALRCATGVQRAVQQVADLPDGERLRVHIGLHAGEAVRDGDDLIGQAVNLASRLTDVAGPDEILVSTLARELAAGSREFVFGPPREVELKGLGPRAAFPLDWRASESV